MQTLDVELARLDAMGQAELARRGDIDVTELAASAVRRIDTLNPLLRAVVTIDRAPRVRSEGPLRGVPFLVKDSTPWPELRWSLGARLFRGQTTRAQTPYGRRLEAAGLACVGKSATAELGLLFSTETWLEGATHNPWDLSRSAAGSSGGAAAAVAAGLVPVAHANDGGGSIRVPASACGVFGFKPSRGRTPSASFASNEFLAITSEHCISRSVRDSALWLSLTEDGDDRVGFVGDPIARPLRIGVTAATLLGGRPSPEVGAALDETARLCAELGHHVEQLTPPPLDGARVADALYLVAGSAVASVVDLLDRARSTPAQEDELEPFTWWLVERFRARPDALAFARAALAEAAAWHRALTGSHDVVLTPTIATPPYPLGHLSPFLPPEELVRRTGAIAGYTPIENAAGAPAMSVPLAWSAGGLPLGMHFASSPGRDTLLLQLAYQLEAARPWRDRWPPLSIPRLAGPVANDLVPR